MTVEEIITKFEGLVEDSLDADLALQLVNDAIYEVDEEVQPQIIKKVSTSATTTAGQTYTTAISLPADIFLPPDEIYVGTDVYTQVPFEQQVLYRDTGNFFYIDWANSQYHLTGRQASAQTITFPYWRTPTTLTTSDTPHWPTRFHSIIPLRMAKLYFALDQGDKSVAWDDRWEAEYQRRLSRFKDWDAKLKLSAIHGQTPYGLASTANDADQISL